MNEQLARSAALFSPSQLTLARHTQGMTKATLAEKIGLTPTAITQFEKGLTKPSPRVIGLLSAELGYAPRFFSLEAAVYDDGGGDPSPFFRSLRNTPQRDRAKATAMARLIYRFSQALEHDVELPELKLPRFPIDSTSSRATIENAATRVRRAWGITDEPIPNLVKLVEKNGILVVRHEFFTDKLSAFSSRFSARPLIVIGDYHDDAARSRFDAAHELGHLVMHRGDEAASKAVEDQAQQFASAFIFPATAFITEFPRRLTWEALASMKRKWGISIAALLYKARDLRLLSEHSYKRIIMEMARLKWKNPEPFALPAVEQPALFELAIAAVPGGPTAVSRLMDDVGMPSELRKTVQQSSGRQRTKLELPQLL